MQNIWQQNKWDTVKGEFRGKFISLNVFVIKKDLNKYSV